MAEVGDLVTSRDRLKNLMSCHVETGVGEGPAWARRLFFERSNQVIRSHLNDSRSLRRRRMKQRHGHGRGVRPMKGRQVTQRHVRQVVRIHDEKAFFGFYEVPMCQNRARIANWIWLSNKPNVYIPRTFRKKALQDVCVTGDIYQHFVDPVTRAEL